MNEDLQTQVAELEDELQTIKTERTKERADFDERLLAVEKILKEHTHRGDDESTAIEKDIELLSGFGFSSGDVASFKGVESAVENRTLSIFGTGRDKSEAEGINNSQVQLEHQYGTDSTTRQTFYYGIRGPIYKGASASFASGDTVLSQADWTWQTNELAGTRVLIYYSATSFGGFEIASNTEKTLTITGGTFASSVTGAQYQVFMPVYLGGATYPWRRAYIEEGTAGGLRIGLGATGGGQNGLLYMDSLGDLYFRSKRAGTFTASTSDLLTLGNKTFTITNGLRLQFSSTNTLPAGLTAGTTYYIIDADDSNSRCKVSLTSGGGAVNITDTGTGTHSYSFTSLVS